MESLGINLKLLIAQIVNFLILLLILRKFLYAPVLNMLDERRVKIEKGIKDGEEAEARLKSAEKNAADLIEKAEQKAQKILEEAKVEAKKAHDKILAEANEKTTKILQNAKEEATSLKENSLKSAKKELSTVVSLAVEKILSNDLSDIEKQNLTAKAIKEL